MPRCIVFVIDTGGFDISDTGSGLGELDRKSRIKWPHSI